MNPLRVSISFRTATEPSDLASAIDTFHRLIQYGRVEGLLLDVADYRHVPQGPGVVLIGHDVDYAVSESAFTVVRKRSMQDDVATQLRDALRMGLGAMAAIEDDGAVGVAFDRSRLTAAAIDRSSGSREEVSTALEAALATLVDEVFGPDGTVSPVEQDDPRAAPEFFVEVPAEATSGALDKLGGARIPGQSPWDISVEELARLRDSDADFVLLDVREESEYETVNLGGTLIPLGQLGDRLDELDKDAHVVVHCRAGRRGATAVQQLRDAGFSDAWNVNGALMAWIDRIDPSLPRY